MSSTNKTFAPITESSRALRWGFLGCGKISSDFANALKHLPNAVFQACAARSKESAQAFADLHGFARAYDSYEQLVSYADIDVVYIGTLHISHYENTLLALNHGKHVIVEKPMTMNAREAARVIALAKEKNLFFMEGMWTRFFPTVRFVREQLANGVIGDVHHVRANIGFPFAEDNARLWQRKLGGGGLLDIGIYPLAFVTMVFGTKPEKITASGKLSSDGVDVYGAVALEYSGNRFGSIDYTCLALFDENVTIIGSKGRIVIHGPAHCGTTVTTTLYGTDGSLTDKVSHFPKVQPHPSSSPVIYGGSEGFYHEIEAVTQAILHNLTEQPEYPPSESLGIMTIMDEIRKQLGVVYPADALN